ncbi:MAG TPA: SIR2 family protein [Polyangiaceae bacterium]|nr:SIR2 family protein [Polyangiaceae bacterium]
MATDRDFETYLPHLLSRYQTGKLVPFVGSGLSVPVCTGWAEFVRRLSSSARLDAAALDMDDPRQLIRYAYSAVRTLKAQKQGTFEAAVRHALVRSPEDAPKPSPAMRALARIWWPLVLTTNYDTTFERALQELGEQSRSDDRLWAVVGRSPEDCQRVLTSFTVAGRTLLWALQGYLGNAPEFQGLPERELLLRLERELVIGHDEYRRVTYREVHFRRAFADVFRHRSLLFVGSGLQESYLQELFGEVLETYGPNSRPHYAFQQRGSVDAEFLRARFQIFVIEYDEHEQVTERLERLHQAVSAPSWAPRRFAFGLNSALEHRRDPPNGPSRDLLAPVERGFEVIAGALPETVEARECIAVSAGGRTGTFFYSRPIRELLKKLGVSAALPEPVDETQMLGHYSGTNVFAVRARSPGDERSLMAIYESCFALFEHIESLGLERIHLQLIAAGRNDGADIRTFPARYSLVQIARAWGDFTRTYARRDNPRVRLLSVYVMDEYVYREVAIGRIDIAELLDCPDLRFFCEILRDDGEIERRLFQMTPHQELGQLSTELNLDAPSWSARVSPSPGLEDAWIELDTCKGRSLQELGIVSGSTVRFHRRRSEGGSCRDDSLPPPSSQ